MPSAKHLHRQHVDVTVNASDVREEEVGNQLEARSAAFRATLDMRQTYT
jgi:hypothetical protein